MIALLENKKRRRKRTNMGEKWLAVRDEKGSNHDTIQELGLDDAKSNRRYLRMNTETFEELLQYVSTKLEKQSWDLSVGQRYRLSHI